MNNSIIVIPSSHRELPVDVPDSFIEIVKVPPRYPPPAHLSSLSSSSNASSSRIRSSASTAIQKHESNNNNNNINLTTASSATLPANIGMNMMNATTKRPPQIVKEVVKTTRSLSSHGSFEKQRAQGQVAIKRNDEVFIFIYIWDIHLL